MPRFARLVVLIATFAFSALVAFGQPSSAAAQPGFRIVGTVIERGTNRALNHVLVTISPTEHRDLQLSCVTDASGRFAFTNLPLGKYSLEAQKRGETPQGYNEYDNYATAVAVGPGLDSENLVFSMDVPGSISGAVLDDEGDPVAQAQIWLFRKAVLSGKSQVFAAGTESTESSGDFYFAHLAPGTYYVAVQGRPWYAQAVPQQQGTEGDANQVSSELDVVYPVTYYSDSLDPASASPIVISEGGSARIQLTVRAVPSVHVELAGLDQQPNRGFGTTLFNAGPEGFLIPANAQIFNLGNQQEISGIAPGRYVLTMQSMAEDRPESIGTKTLELTGTSTLDVRDLPKTSLAGEITFEGNEHPNGPVEIQLSPMVQSYGGQTFAFGITKDGLLMAQGRQVMPGHYELQLVGASGFYVKSLSAKGAKTSGNQIDIAEGAAVHLSIVAAKGLTRVDGVALKDGNPIAGTMVLLVPQDLREATRFRRDQSDSDGTFSLFDVVPGRYTILAIDNGRDLEYQNPAVIRDYITQGEVVDIPLPTHAALKVNVQVRR